MTERPFTITTALINKGLAIRSKGVRPGECVAALPLDDLAVDEVVRVPNQALVFDCPVLKQQKVSFYR